MPATLDGSSGAGGGEEFPYHDQAGPPRRTARGGDPDPAVLGPGRAEPQETATDTHRLLALVRHMNAHTFTQTFRNGLSSDALLRIINALPTDRRTALTDHARTRRDPQPRHRQPPEPHPDELLATVIRTARKRAGMGQAELAATLGIRQSSVSQWERGLTEPSKTHLTALMRILPSISDDLRRAHPGLAEALNTTADRPP